MRRLVICLINALAILMPAGLLSQPINRRRVVQRHIVTNTRFDSLSSLSVGNGRFAFTVDVTGLQSFPEACANGVPLGTESEWGWHSFPDTANYDIKEALQYYQLNGRSIPYAVQVKEPARSRDAVNWLRQNPHRLQLGNIGIEMLKRNGTKATLNDISDIHQTLDPWTGEIRSHFSLEGEPVEVITYCHQQQDIISAKIESPLLQQHRLFIRLRFPYPNGEFKDAGVNWNTTQQESYFMNDTHGGTINRVLDGKTEYHVRCAWQGIATVKQYEKNYFLLQPASGTVFSFSVGFSKTNNINPIPAFAQTLESSRKGFQKFWLSGAAIDLSGNTDPRAHELERRVILSQYLTRIQCAGNQPPQETGLTYNSWYGKPHLEMHWWHGVHFALWGRPELLAGSLSWYKKVMPEARKIAARQGYDGVRWQKMTDPEGQESPSSVGAFLIWQQPHIIYFAELLYRANPARETLEKYRGLVFATADFMASYAFYDSATKKYRLGPGLIPAQEKFHPAETFNPSYELAYWEWALRTASGWRKRLGLPANDKWRNIERQLSPLPAQDGKYLFAESAADSYTNPAFRTDHPAVLATLGVLPPSPRVDTAIMHRTFNWIIDNWSWRNTWGWDFPMTAMTAARLGLPEAAVNALLMPIQTNTYLSNGHNYQDARLTIYLPGNGGLLTAMAMMCGGYDGATKRYPGIPANWKIKTEGFRKMP